MRVCQVDIENFRGIQSATIALPDHSVLLGANNVGKSAVIDALALLLGRRRLVRDLWEHDFFGSSPQPESRISLTATVTNFAPDSVAAHPNWFGADGATPLWLLPDGQLVPGERPQDGRLAMQVGFSARFDDEALEVETLRYFKDGDTDPFQEPQLRLLRSRHLQELGFFLLPSHRTWDRVLSFSSDLFRRILRVEEAVPGPAIVQLRDWLRSPAERLEEFPQLKDLIGRVEGELGRYIGEGEAHLSFRPTTGDIEGVLKAVTPHLGGKAGEAVPLGKHGSGVISLQTILLLLEVGRSRSADGKSFMLAAEEPELHLHPGHHRRLVARIRGVSGQSISTTHSPEVAAYYKPEEVVLLRNRNGRVDATPLLRTGEEVPEKNALMRLYTLYRADLCEALMHSVAVVPEGPTEYRWFRGLLRSCITAEGWHDLDAQEISAHALGVLPTQDAQVVATYRHFAAMLPELLPLVDGDDAGRDYVKKLKKLAPSPPRVARLGDGADLETVLAWILTPTSGEATRWQDLRATLSTLTDDTAKALRSSLKDTKQHWQVHDQLLALIASNHDAADRARTFLADLVSIATCKTDQLQRWEKDEQASTDTTTVWRWIVPQSLAGD